MTRLPEGQGLAFQANACGMRHAKAVAMKSTILISDDELLIARALQHRFQELGIRAVVDASCRLSRVAASVKPNVIIVDLGQRVGGPELIRALKEQPRLAGIPVFACGTVFTEALAAE